MNTQEAIVKRFIELTKERGLSIRGLAYVSGISPSTVKNIFNGASQNPGIVTIKKLCDGLGITLTEFFDTDTFRTLEQEIQ